MPYFTSDFPIDDFGDPRIPPELRVKARKMAQDRIASAEGRVVSRAERMTPKKAAKLTADQESQAIERARQRYARQKQFAANPEPSFNRPDTQVGEPSAYSALNTPEDKARFTPRAGMRDMQFSLKEGIRQDLVEKYAVPDGTADAIASNAVDRWAQITRKGERPSFPGPTIPVTEVPRFLIHPFSDVQYPEGDDMTQTMGGYSPRQVRQKIQRLRSNRTLGGIDWGVLANPASADPNAWDQSKMVATFEREWRSTDTGELVWKRDTSYPAMPSAWTSTGRTRPLSGDQPSGGSLDAKDTVVPITPSDPTTKEPLTPTPVDIAKAAVAEAKAENQGSVLIPLAIGAGVLVLLLRK